ncbi:hypothetical protein ACFLRP_03080 [Bacteroidota bacterium]
MFGLSEKVLFQMLTKDIPVKSYEGYAEFIHTHLIPNIVEVIAANNEVILSHLEQERINDDSGKQY